MGVANLKDLVDDGQPVSPEEIDAHREGLVDEAKQSFETRAEVEMEFATKREEIETAYSEAIVKAEEKRDKASLKNFEKRQKALEKLGLNPDGSDPRDRPQGTF